MNEIPVKGTVEDLGTKFISMQLVQRNPDQPRINFDEQKLKELAESIATNGLLQPIVLRHLESEYVIIAGERRWRAHQILQRNQIHARIIECDEKTAYELTLLENLQREDLDLIEEARGYEHLKRKFQYTLQELGKIVGKAKSTISNIMGILKEDPKVQEYVKNGVLNIAILVWLKQLPNLHEKLELLRKLQEEKVPRTGVRKYVEHVSEAYRIAEELGVDPQDILEKRVKRVGKGGRFDVKSQEIIPDDFRFYFIVDNLVGAEDLEYFPRVNILSSAFEYLHNKGASKHLAQLMLARETIENWMMDSGVVPASKKEQWGFFDKSEQLFAFYEQVKPDVCVALDVPAYKPVFEKWGLNIEQVIEKTWSNAEKFRDWKPSWDTTKVYALQGVTKGDYLVSFWGLLDRGVFENGDKVAVGFGAIARTPLESIVEKVRYVVRDPEFQAVKPKLEFIHGFGVGQSRRIAVLYQEGVNSFDALTCTVVTATGQYLLRNGKYYPHIVHESPIMRRVRMHFNVNSFWGLLTEEFAKVKGVQHQMSDAVRQGIEKGMLKLEGEFADVRSEPE